MKLIGQDRPWTLPGPEGTVTVIGVVFEGDEATLDNGALHSRSHLEAGVSFSEDPARQGRGERVVTAWVSYPGVIPEKYLGVTTSFAWIDGATKTGWKKWIDHVNRMSSAVRGTIDAGDLSAAQKKSLAALLAAYSAKAWEKTGEAFKQALA